MRLLCFFLGVVFLTSAQAMESLNLEQAIKMSRQNSEEIKLAQSQVLKTKEQGREALSYALPQLSVETTVNKYNEVPTFDGFSLNKRNELVSGFAFNQAVFSFGAVGNGIVAARKSTAFAQLKGESLSREIEYITKVSYFTVLFMRESVKVFEDSLKNAKENLKTLDKNFGRGRAPQADLIKLKADVSGREVQLRDVKRQYELAKIQLNQVIGKENYKKYYYMGKLEDFISFKNHGDSKQLIEQSFSVRALKEKIELDQKIADVQWGQSMPQIGFFYRYNMTDRSDEKFFGKEDRIKASIVGLNLRWNVWDGGGQRSRYRQALLDKTISQVNLAKERRGLTKEIYDKTAQIESYKATLPHLNKTIKLSEKSLLLSRQRFRYGKTSASELNDAENFLTQSKFSRVTTIYNLVQAVAFLEKFRLEKM